MLDFKISKFAITDVICDAEKIFSNSDFKQMPKQNLHIKSLSLKNGTQLDVAQCLVEKGCWASYTVYGQQGATASPRHGFALVDTGSNVCSLQGYIADELGIIPDEKPVETSGIAGKQLIQTASNVMIKIDELNLNLFVPKMRILRDEASEDWKKRNGENFFGMIGRDVLGYCRFFYDGINGTAYLETDEESDENPQESQKA